jgi:hypothetical protein
MSYNSLSKALANLNFDDPVSIKTLKHAMRPRLHNIFFTPSPSLEETSIKLEEKSHEPILALTKNEIINYVLLADKKSHIDDINKNFLEILNKHNLSKELVQILYTTHLEFTINNELNFNNHIKFDLLIDDNYLNLKKIFLETKKYIDTFIDHNDCSFNITKIIEEEDIENNIIDAYQNEENKENKNVISTLSRKLTRKSTMPIKLSSMSPMSPRSPISPRFKLPISPFKSLSLSPFSKSKSSLSSPSSELSSESSPTSLKRSVTKMTKTLSHKLSGNPKKSIFFNTEPIKIAKAMHKLSLKLFYLINLAEFQYISRAEDRSLENNYNLYYSNFYPNLVAKLNSEIEIYCENNKLKLLFNNLKDCIEYFFKVNNQPLIRIFLGAFIYFGDCLKDEVTNYLRLTNDKLRTMKKKYGGLTPGYTIKGNFIVLLSSQDNIELKLIKIEKIVNLITETKKIISETYFKEEMYTECIVFEYINPNSLINIKLYKESRSGDIKCIKEPNAKLIC